MIIRYHKSGGRKRSVAGFTLLEILIALVIVAIVVSIIFGAYSSTFKIIDAAQSQADIYQMARIATQRIQEDLECSRLSVNPGMAADFIGKHETLKDRDADSLSFLSAKHLSLDAADAYSGPARISFYCMAEEEKDEKADDKGLMLYRSDTPLFEQPPDEKTGGLILCDHLFSVNFQYYDAESTEYEDWDSSEGQFQGKLPSMVSVELTFIDQSNPDEPLKFIAKVAVPMAQPDRGIGNEE